MLSILKKEKEMGDILDKSDTVSLTNLTDPWGLNLEAGKRYKYKVENIGNHGKFNFVIKAEELNYGEVPIKDKWRNIKKISVNPGETKNGSFIAPQSIYGLNSYDSNAEKRSFISVNIHWIPTVHKANYRIRIYE